MDPSARSTAAQIVLVNITMEMVTTSAAPSPDPSGQSPPSLSSSDLTYTSPNQASVQHGQLKQLQQQLQQQPQLQQRQLVDPTHPQVTLHCSFLTYEPNAVF